MFICFTAPSCEAMTWSHRSHWNILPKIVRKDVLITLYKINFLKMCLIWLETFYFSKQYVGQEHLEISFCFPSGSQKFHKNLDIFQNGIKFETHKEISRNFGFNEKYNVIT